jgi:hypothetical protein
MFGKLRFVEAMWLLVTDDWRKLRCEELHNLYSSPNIKVIKSKRMRWA